MRFPIYRVSLNETFGPFKLTEKRFTEKRKKTLMIS